MLISSNKALPAPADPQPEANEGAGTRLRRWLNRHPEIWVALVLFVASYAFVYTFAQFVRWNTGRPTNLLQVCTWDCNWFRFVVDSGYDVLPRWQAPRFDHANWSFLPLFPLTALREYRAFYIDRTSKQWHPSR